MAIFARKTTKVYQDGKLVNTIKTNMSKKKYHEDLSKTVVRAASSNDKVKLKIGFMDDAAVGKVDGVKQTGYRTMGGKSVKWVWDSSYKYPVSKKGIKRSQSKRARK